MKGLFLAFQKRSRWKMNSTKSIAGIKSGFQLNALQIRDRLCTKIAKSADKAEKTLHLTLYI